MIFAYSENNSVLETIKNMIVKLIVSVLFVEILGVQNQTTCLMVEVAQNAHLKDVQI